MSDAGPWVVEKHARGGLRVALFRDVMERNKFMMKRGQEPHWYVVDTAQSMDEAREKERALKRESKCEAATQQLN